MTVDKQHIASLLADYLAGPQVLRKSVAGLSPEQMLAHPIAGKWSVHEVVCHLSDCEGLYADRIKRVIAEDRPTLMNVDPDLHVAKLALSVRNIEDELSLIELTRKQVGRILQTLPAEAFERVGIHSHDGPLSLETLLGRVTRHIPHHAMFIDEKRQALAG